MVLRQTIVPCPLSIPPFAETTNEGGREEEEEEEEDHVSQLAAAFLK